MQTLRHDLLTSATKRPPPRPWSYGASFRTKRLREIPKAFMKPVPSLHVNLKETQDLPPREIPPKAPALTQKDQVMDNDTRSPSLGSHLS